MPGKSVGVIRAGQPAHQNDKNRSLSLDVISDIFEVKRIASFLTSHATCDRECRSTHGTTWSLSTPP